MGSQGRDGCRPFAVTIDEGGPNERAVDALADGEPVRTGEVVRIRTTGGGGWGDPLDRPVDEVLRDIRWGKVSLGGAHEDYAVVVTGLVDAPVLDEAATDSLRRHRRESRPTEQPFFDRGPGYARLSGGATSAAVDWL